MEIYVYVNEDFLIYLTTEDSILCAFVKIMFNQALHNLFLWG